MAGKQEVLTRTDLTTFLQRWVEQRTQAKIHCLEVQSTGTTITLHGFTRSYSTRQLAVTAVLDALAAYDSLRAGTAGLPGSSGPAGGAGDYTVDNRIEVCDYY